MPSRAPWMSTPSASVSVSVGPGARLAMRRKRHADGSTSNVIDPDVHLRGREAMVAAARRSVERQQGRPSRASIVDRINGKPPGGDPFLGAMLAGRYKVEQLIASGGCSRVYRGVQVSIGRRVAIKVVRPDLGPSLTRSLEPRFRREAAAVGAMQHPHIVTVLDFGRTAEGTLFLVMELLEGKTLQALIREGPVEPIRALALWLQVALALRHAHLHGLIHRDIKPGNILVSQADDHNDFAKLLDFGLVKVADDLLQTQVGTMMGTPQYLSPEQALGRTADGRTDIYSLGIVMYKALTGVHPYDAPNTFVMALRSTREPYPPMVSMAPHVSVPPLVEQIVRRCMEKAARGPLPQRQRPHHRPARRDSARWLPANIPRRSTRLRSPGARARTPRPPGVDPDDELDGGPPGAASARLESRARSRPAHVHGALAGAEQVGHGRGGLGRRQRCCSRALSLWNGAPAPHRGRCRQWQRALPSPLRPRAPLPRRRQQRPPERQQSPWPTMRQATWGSRGGAPVERAVAAGSRPSRDASTDGTADQADHDEVKPEADAALPPCRGSDGRRSRRRRAGTPPAPPRQEPPRPVAPNRRQPQPRPPRQSPPPPRQCPSPTPLRWPTSGKRRVPPPHPRPPPAPCTSA